MGKRRVRGKAFVIYKIQTAVRMWGSKNGVPCDSLLSRGTSGKTFHEAEWQERKVQRVCNTQHREWCQQSISIAVQQIVGIFLHALHRTWCPKFISRPALQHPIQQVPAATLQRLGWEKVSPNSCIEEASWNSNVEKSPHWRKKWC